MKLDESVFQRDKQPRLGQIFAEETRKYPWSSSLEPLYSRLFAGDQAIFERLDNDQSFSKALWDICLPPLEQQEFWHYTSLDALEKIVRTRGIWLHSLMRRMGQEEITTFADKFSYLGFYDSDENGYRQMYALARDLFFLSLSDGESPGQMWDHFGDVRLRLRVVPTLERATLRRMAYTFADTHPLKVLNKVARDQFNRGFIPWQTSFRCAFYLGSYAYESEVRLLMKRFEETTDLEVRKTANGEVVVIPIGCATERVKIDILEIETQTTEGRDRAEELLQQVPDWQLPAKVYKPAY
jgi:hypothetical protein